MEFIYKATLESDPDGGFIVRFADVPEALTHGMTREEALANAQEALGLALRGIVQDGRPLPQPAARRGVPVAVDPEDAIKLAVIQAFQQSGISKSELARRLGKSENEARRILDPDHRTKLGQMQEAMGALGRTIVVSIMEPA